MRWLWWLCWFLRNLKIGTLPQSDIIKTLTELVEKQAAQISALLVRVENLEQELSFYKSRKNSGNSHIPPSVSLNKPQRNQSLREKSGKKAGGQQGHKGSTLAFSPAPDPDRYPCPWLLRALRQWPGRYYSCLLKQASGNRYSYAFTGLYRTSDIRENLFLRIY